MDFLCNECAKSFAKEVDLVIHQSRAHDKRHFSCEVCQENFIGKDKHRDHIRKHNKKKETPKKSTCVHLALTKHHTNICSSCPYETPCKRYLIKHVKTHDKEKVYGAPKFCPGCGKSFPAKRNLTKHLKIHQSLFSFNMSGYYVVVGDLLVVPLGPFPLDTLINFWLPLDPLPASSLSNYSLPIDFVYNNLDQAFWFYSKAWINHIERFILQFMNWQTTQSPWL